MEWSSRAWRTTLCVLCRRSTDLSWEGEEPYAAAVEEDPPAAVEESASLPQDGTVALGVEVTPPEATIVEGMYTAVNRLPQVVVVAPNTDVVCLVLRETQVGGTTIPEAMSVEGVVHEVEVLVGAAVEPGVTLAPEATEEVHDDALPESSMDVVVRSPEIQDAEPIRSAPMSETTTVGRDGLELLADDLINPAVVARNLESMRQAEQSMKVRGSTLE
jgi:hypothetical protein